MRATLSTNIPEDADRKTLAAIKAACVAAATEHHHRHIPWHFELFAIDKYHYEERSRAYNELKTKLGLPLNPLQFRGKTLAEVMTSFTISATGTRGATLRMKASLLGATTGRVLDIEAIKRMLADERKKHQHPRLMRLLARLVKNDGKMTYGQRQAVYRHAELTAIADDERNHLVRVEEETFTKEMARPEPMRTVGGSRT
jgi:hypothetical protein